MGETTHMVRDDVQLFLTMLEQIGGPQLHEGTPEEGRAQMAAMGGLAEAAPRELPVIRDLTCPGPAGDIPLRFYDTQEQRGPGPCVVFIHGGGFVIGNLDIYHAICTELCALLDLPLVSVDYRLAPETPSPLRLTIVRPWRAGSPPALMRWGARSPGWLSRGIVRAAISPSLPPMR